MRIKKLELKNFRGFEDLTIDFPEGESGLAVFVGVNGSGKTSVLDAANNLFHQFAFNLYDQENTELDKIKKRVFRTSFRRNEVHVGAKYANTQMHIDSNNVSVKANEEIDINGSVSSSTYTLDGNAIGLGGTPEMAVPQSVLYNRKELKKIPFIYAYYPDDRSVHYEPLLTIEDISSLSFIDTLKNAFDVKVDFGNLFKWFRNLEDLENQKRLRNDSKYRHNGLEKIRTTISKFLPNVSSPYVNREGREELVVLKGNEELSISQLSLGERLVIAIVSDIALKLQIANPKMDDSNLGHGIVLIDEIEQHLHPKWQRDIIKNLRDTFPNIQFILTTHSPQVLSNVPRENVFILNDFKLEKNKPHTEGRDSNAILEDIFDVPSRPEEEKNELEALFDAIEKGDKEKAQQLHDGLKKKLGDRDIELQRAENYMELLID